MTALRVLQTINSLSVDHGGPSRSVTALCAALAAHGCEVHLLSRATAGEARVTPAAPVVDVVIPRSGRAVHALVDLWRQRRAMRDELAGFRPAVVHDHGAWLGTNALVALTAARHHIPLVVSTRGMFSSHALALGSARKRIAFALYQRRILEHAAVLHATSEEEAKALRACGVRTAIALVPNGVALPSIDPAPSRDQKVVYFGRLHEIKGLPMLLDAWASAHRPGWRLELTGPGPEPYRAMLRQRAAALGVSGSVLVREPEAESARAAYLASARVLVLPSFSENFGMSVAEALAAEVPAIATTGAPWRALRDERCGWWVDPTPDALARALDEAMRAEPQQLHAMGRRGRELVARRFSWDAVAAQLVHTYEWVTGHADRPAFVLPRDDGER